METLQDRLKRFIAAMDISVLSFENKCGIAQGTVNKMTDKSRLRTLEKIRLSFPQLNIGWLKTGEGEMLNEPIAKINISHSPNSAASVNGNAIVYTADEHELIRLREENRQLYERIAELKKINDYLMNNNKFPCS